MSGMSEVTADSIEDLGRALDIDAEQFAATVAEYNASIDTSIPFDPNVKDGRSARVEPPKTQTGCVSIWATTPPTPTTTSTPTNASGWLWRGCSSV